MVNSPSVEAELAGRASGPAARSDGSATGGLAMLLDILGDPQRAYPVIAVTGPGAAAASRLADSLLRAFGLRTGRIGGPDEGSEASATARIALDGKAIADERMVEVYDDLAPYLPMVDERQGSPLTRDEVVAALGFAAFADAPVDVAVLAVADASDPLALTSPDLAVVTAVPDSSTEVPALVLREGGTAVLAAQPPEVAAALLRLAGAKNAVIAREGLEFGVIDRLVGVGGQALRLQGLAGDYDDLFVPLHGPDQAQHAVAALAAVEAFFGKGADTGRLEPELVREGLARGNAPGRLEAIRSAPTVLLDAAEDPAGMAAAVAALGEAFSFRRLVGVVGMLAGSDARGMLLALEPVLDEVVITMPAAPRRATADEVAAAAVEVFGDERVAVELRLDDAYETAVRLAEGDGDTELAGAGVLITGSAALVADARSLLGSR